MAGVYSYDTTAGNNTTIAGVSVAEGMAPADVNNAIRGMAADLAKWQDDIGAKTSLGGSADNYTLTTSSTITAYADGQLFIAICNASNTGAAVINIDTVGSKKIRKVTSSSTNDVALIANDMREGQPCLFIYRAAADSATGALILLNPLSGLADGILTTRGDIITRSATGPQRLALGTSAQFLGSDGTDVAWETPPTLVGDSGSGGTVGYAPAPSAGDAAAGKFLKADATWAVPSSASAATQAEQETGSSTSVFVSPGRQHFHPSAAKAWVRYTQVTTTTIASSYNVTSLTDNGTGNANINFTTSFSGVGYTGVGMSGGGSYIANQSSGEVPTVSTFRAETFDLSNVNQDARYAAFAFFGDL